MKFNNLLEEHDIDPKSVVILRHRPKEREFRNILLVAANQKPDLYNAYQQTQTKRAEKMMQRADYVASFVGHEPNYAVFVGLYERGRSRQMTLSQYSANPLVKELRGYGMAGWQGDERRHILWFDLKLMDFYKKWSGRLVVNWSGGERTWVRQAVSKNSKFEIDHIKEEAVFDLPIPDWNEIVLSWDELKVLPQRWKIALSHWRGIYLIFDVSSSQAYVGSAYGKHNILGRWLGYKKPATVGIRSCDNAIRKTSSFRFYSECRPIWIQTSLSAWKRLGKSVFIHVNSD